MTSRYAFHPRQLIAVVLLGGALRAQVPPKAAAPAHEDALAAALVGRVTDSAGVGLPGAEIALIGSEMTRLITDDSGHFHITGLPAGVNVFNVRRLGYQPASFTATLKPGKTHRATFTLNITAHPLPTIAVSDTAQTSHWLDLFQRRRGSNHGAFFTRDDIVRKGARLGTDIVRMVPGVRLVPVRGGGAYQVVMTRGAGARSCLPTMFVHNVPYSGTLDDFIADDIEALEVYVGISEIPPELDKNGRGVCGAIVVWTRDPRKAP
jgi:hypothetical protein